MQKNINEGKKPTNPALSGDVDAEIPDAEAKSASPDVPAKNKNGDKAMNKLVTKEDIDITDDVTAIFEGTELSEEFKIKATEIFETALVSKINEKIEEITEQMEEEADEEFQEVIEDLTEKMNEYLDYVVENWIEENKLAVDVGLKAQMTEEFISGLRKLFTEHYVDIPEDKVDMVEELASKIESLETTINEEMNKNIQLKKLVESYEREVAFTAMTEGLTDTQASKLESLSEALNYDDAETFKSKLQTLRESYFPDSQTMKREITLDDEPIDMEEEKYIDPSMSVYVDSIARSVKK